MDILLILTYAAVCVVVFKVFRIPLNKWTVPTAVLGGIVLLGALLLIMNYNHPYSESVRQYYVTTPMIPEVRGRVVAVPIEPNVLVKEGDVLFKIDPEPFEDEVRGLEGQLEVAEANLERAEELYVKKVGSEVARDEARARVDDLRARLEDARFDLEQTVVTAPSDGFVTQLALRPGMMALPLAYSPALVFAHKEAHTFIGWFRQNSLLRLEPGSEAEVTLDGIPGVIFEGKIKEILPVIGDGQLKPGADLLRFNQRGESPGRVAVAIEITDPAIGEHRIPLGAYGQGAVYSEHFHHVGVLRRVLLRMAGWMNYVFPMH